MKKFWDEGKLAIMHGVGYPNSPRSHFRSMDIWHTCEPDKVGTEGWLGRVAREFDPKKENVVTDRQLRPVPVPRPVGARRSGGLRGRPAGDVRLPAGHPGASSSAWRCSIVSRGCTSRWSGSGVMEYLGTTGLDSLEGCGHPEGGAAEVQLRR